jgi:hypothetical protein
MNPGHTLHSSAPTPAPPFQCQDDDLDDDDLEDDEDGEGGDWDEDDEGGEDDDEDDEEPETWQVRLTSSGIPA